jgi:hypothetical protein
MKPANEKLFYYAMLVYSFGMLASILIPGNFEEVRDPPRIATGAMGPPIIAAVCSEATATKEKDARLSLSGGQADQEIVTEPCGVPIEEAVRTLVEPPGGNVLPPEGRFVAPEHPRAADKVADQHL